MTDSLTSCTDTSTGSPLDLDPQPLASQAAEAVRSLNHATLWPGSGYETAADVAAAISELRRLASYLPQALTQAARWLAQAESQGRITTDHLPGGGNARLTTVSAVHALTTAAAYAASLAADLGEAQEAASHLVTDAALDASIPYLLSEAQVRP